MDDVPETETDVDALVDLMRHEGDRWRLAHRHADPLVHPIPFGEMARLARGLDPPEGAPGSGG